jgi:MscS family membrane protein
MRRFARLLPVLAPRPVFAQPPAVVPVAAPATAPAGVAPAAAQTAARDLLEHFVDTLQLRIFPDGSHGELVHGIACGVLLLAAVLLRHFITNIIFSGLKRLAEKTETTLDDKLFPALEGPAATLVMVCGIFAALTVLKLPPAVDRLIDYGAQIALLTVLFWGVLRAGGAILDHFEEIGHERKMNIAHFMPLIKRTLAVFVIIFGVLMVIKSLGVDVGAVLAGLGIGGLAFAFAAQDTIANLFGSMVVVMDQPFKVGEVVKIGAQTGTVEDIGLRSTRIRLVDRSLVVMPNKMVAAEAVVNLSRFTSRRVEQTLGLTYDTKPEQLEAFLAELRHLILNEKEVDPASVIVFFTQFGASSLDLLVAYVATSPDNLAHLQLRERLNLAFMRAVAARGLAFAFPTQTVQLEGPVAKALAEKKL